ncbi:hypothetical protein N7537_005197 [Penicillium hordei]|uniref:Uncharacterized protein n=1 Tax=Penicillium hordei TaxID=40994 RepID=A0AAD6H6Y3_9EURO|nr:uncharacterized protein N7537_005197 [Penicillium hordei]KAJ5608578.1 hypothetical protein N7537_005197 [Penicillium hordei]
MAGYVLRVETKLQPQSRPSQPDLFNRPDQLMRLHRWTPPRGKIKLAAQVPTPAITTSGCERPN